MKILQLMEGRDDIVLFCQFLCSFAQLGFGFKILLEVILACFVVELQQVVELLHVELVVLPYLVSLVGRDGLDILPLLLQRLEVLV